MNRLVQLFETKKNILSIYFTAGYPKLDDTLPILNYLSNADVDLVEIGIPYSDPLADGPVIQKSSSLAIENGMSITKLFSQLSGFRKTNSIPAVLMGYLNPIIQYGEDRFFESCLENEIDGLIIPDMPLDYYEAHWKTKLEKSNIAMVFLITPQTSEDRIRKIDNLSQGFIYMVSSNSITGQTNEFSESVEPYFNRISNMNLTTPRLVGFGIHDRHTFKKACQYSQGAIVGSAFIQHLGDSISEQKISDFVAKLRK